MGIGEAVVTVLSDNGAPTPVAWTRLRPPSSLMAQLDPEQQQAMVAASPLLAEYGTPVDRDSAYERLLAKVAPAGSGPRRSRPREEPGAGRGAPAAGARAARGEQDRGGAGLAGVQELRAGGGGGGGPGDQPVAVRHGVAQAADELAVEGLRQLVGTGSRR